MAGGGFEIKLVGGGDAVAAVTFGAVEGLVGGDDEVVGAGHRRGEGGDAEAGGHGRLGQGADSITLRQREATIMAAAVSVCGRIRANSSPP